jgi:hypothetical protein
MYSVEFRVASYIFSNLFVNQHLMFITVSHQSAYFSSPDEDKKLTKEGQYLINPSAGTNGYLPEERNIPADPIFRASNYQEPELPNVGHSNPDIEEDGNIAINDVQEQGDNYMHDELNFVEESMNSTPTGEDSLGRELTLTNEENDNIEEHMYELLFDEVKGKGFMYPTYNSLGWAADVHNDQIILRVVWRGADGTTDTFDDNPYDHQLGNRFAMDGTDNSYGSCIAGGQIYNPSNIVSDLSKLNKDQVSIISTIPSLIAQFLSPKNMPSVEQTLKSQKKLSETFQSVLNIFERKLMLEDVCSNDSVRIELSYVLPFATGDKLLVDFYFPSCETHNGGLSHLDLNMAIMKVNQSDKYHWVKNFLNYTIRPLQELVTDANLNHFQLSPEIKTSYVFIAERLTMNVMNSYYVGTIHRHVKPYLNPCGEWSVPINLRTQLTNREQTRTGLKWGVKPVCLPTIADYYADAPNIAKGIDFSRWALSEFNKKMTNPQVFVEGTLLLWGGLQKASLPDPGNAGNVGLFEEPDWDRLSGLEGEQLISLFDSLCWTILKSYDDNWKLLINKRKKKDYSATQTVYQPTAVIPKNVGTFGLQNPTMYRAWEDIIPPIFQKYVSQNDRENITSVGKFLVLSLSYKPISRYIIRHLVCNPGFKLG